MEIKSDFSNVWQFLDNLIRGITEDLAAPVEVDSVTPNSLESTYNTIRERNIADKLRRIMGR